MWSFRRYFYRIFLPLLFVAAVAAVLRWNMIRDFNEENVRREPVESELRDGGPPNYAERISRKVEFSEENRSHVVAALQQARQQLKRSFEDEAGSESALENEALQAAEEKMESGIEALDTADENNWDERREAAYQALQEYADKTRALMAGGE